MTSDNVLLIHLLDAHTALSVAYYGVDTERKSLQDAVLKAKQATEEAITFIAQEKAR